MYWYLHNASFQPWCCLYMVSIAKLLSSSSVAVRIKSNLQWLYDTYLSGAPAYALRFWVVHNIYTFYELSTLFVSSFFLWFLCLSFLDVFFVVIHWFFAIHFEFWIIWFAVPTELFSRYIFQNPQTPAKWLIDIRVTANHRCLLSFVWVLRLTWPFFR